MQHSAALSGGAARRRKPSGLRAGATRSHIRGPREALALVGDELLQCERVLREVVGSDVGAVTEIAHYLTDAGGKRLRPALTALGARVIGHSARLDELMSCGELIHLGSLLHDDVVDHADTRRGQPAARVVYGNAVSVLTGDFCVARALLLAADAGGAEAAVELARTVAEMSEGEVLQLQIAGTLDVDLERYFDVIDRKSASLISWCTSAAALGRDDVAMAALREYGRKVGLAFQITDDVLDYGSDTGKDAGADIRERKVTLPLLYAFEVAPELRDRLRAGPPTDEELPELIEAVRSTGALQRSVDVAHRFVEDALVALEVLPESDARAALEVLATFLVERTS